MDDRGTNPFTFTFFNSIIIYFMSNQTSDKNKRIAKNTLLLNALYDGGVVVYVLFHIEHVGSGEL